MATELSRTELTRKIKDAGFVNSFVETKSQANEQIVTGDLSFVPLSNGLKVHYSDVIENSNSHTTAEIEPSISFNILFSGEVSFALSNNKFTFEAHKKPLLFINVLNESQVFTRFFIKDNLVQKLNITADKSWILARCATDEQRQQVENLFIQSQSVYKWQCSKQMLTLSKLLFKNSAMENCKFEWELEQQALQILAYAFPLLLKAAHDKNATNKEKEITIARNAVSYEQQISSILYDNDTLEQVAMKLGASISTLQRYFKARHQLTLREYMRNQKLEQARRSLIFDQITIGEASYLAGYNHVSNFSSAFKKYFSITPAVLQKQYLN